MRIILILIGLIVLAAIYWMGRRDERRAQEKKAARQQKVATIDDDEPDIYQPASESQSESWDYDRFYMSETDHEILFKSPVNRETRADSSAGSGYFSAATSTEESVFVSAEEPQQAIELPTGIEPLLINLAVMAPQDMTFDPNFLKQTLDDSGLSYGELNIYHYYRRPKSELEPNRGQRLFSIANMVEPGYFDPLNINTYRSPGLVLFLQLPGPIDGVLAFEKMHQMGEMLAKRLSGILCDDKHNKITPQSITHIKDEIAEYNLKLRTKLGRTMH